MLETAELNRDDALQCQAYRRLNREDKSKIQSRLTEKMRRSLASRSDLLKIGDERLLGGKFGRIPQLFLRGIKIPETTNASNYM